MKAVIWSRYGPPEVLQFQDVPNPSPRENEILVKIHATPVSAGDCEQRALNLPLWYRFAMRMYIGFRKPIRITILGMELAGEVIEIGKEVTKFKVGDQVFASTSFEGMGTYSEYICLPETSDEGTIVIKPSNMSYEEAATIPIGGIEALSFLRQGNLQNGQQILINGAAGTIGTFAVQLAKLFGAEVTAVDSTSKLDFLRSLGADHVIDFIKEDFTKREEKYDFILDIVSKSSFTGSLKCLNPNGYYLIANPSFSQMIRKRWTSFTSSKKVIFGAVHPSNKDLDYLKELIEAGSLKTFIDKIFPLDQARNAHEYVESGLKKGHVVLSIMHV